MRLFIFVAGGCVSLFFMAFFKEHEFEKEPIVVFVIAMTMIVLAWGIFIYTNRKLFNQVTVEPSSKNVEIFMQTLSREEKEATAMGRGRTGFSLHSELVTQYGN